MVPITVQHYSAAKTLELVNELKTAGLIVNQDFEWSFHAEKVNNGKIVEKHCQFRFREPKLATFYALKWQMKT